MKLTKTLLSADGIDLTAANEREERQVALEYVAEAWNEAEDDGVATLALAHASLFAAITSLVEYHGEAATAELIATLPDRIRVGRVQSRAAAAVGRPAGATRRLLPVGEREVVAMIALNTRTRSSHRHPRA